MRYLSWYGCYGGSPWSHRLAEGAMAHPAKFAHGLATRIVQHGLKQGYWQVGDVIADPFGGVGCGGVVCADHGLWWIGMELSPNFADLARQTFIHNMSGWQLTGKPVPLIFTGDSRTDFASGVTGVAGLVRKTCAGIVTSPPYAHQSEPRRCKPMDEQHDGKQWGGPNSVVRARGYDDVAGELGALKEGSHADVVGIITSPPYEKAQSGGGIAAALRGESDYTLTMSGNVGSVYMSGSQGTDEGQLAELDGETYWEAVALIYGQCYAALSPSGTMAVVVKDFVRKGKRMPFCQQTWEMLLAIGFEPLERVRAWLVAEHEQPSLLDGVETQHKEHKSFFRRLHESRGSPRVDYEEVLFVTRSC